MKSKQILVWMLLILTLCVPQMMFYSQENCEEIQSPEPCEDCMPGLLEKLGTIQVDGITASLTKFGPFIEKVATLLDGIDTNLLGPIKQLVGSVRLLLLAVRDDFKPLTDELRTALEKTFPCPRLQVLFINLETNLNVLLDFILNNDQPILDAQDFSILSNELANVSTQACPKIKNLADQFVKNMLEVLGMCNTWYAMISPIVAKFVKQFPALLRLMSKLMVTDGKGFSSLADLKNHSSSLISMFFDDTVKKLINIFNSLNEAVDGGNIIELLDSYMGATGITTLFKKIFNDIKEAGLGDSIKKLIGAILKLLNDIQAIIPKYQNPFL